MKSAPFFLSICCGAGGSSLGAKAIGCNTLGIEIDPKIAELYRTNVGEVLVQDVTTLDPYKVEVPSKSDRLGGQLLIVQVSPPCQDYSVANTGSKNSTRADLLRATFHHYEVWQPDVVILENVWAYRYSRVYADFEKHLQSLGYKCLPLLLNAADFGVPQSRQRFISIFVRKELPLPTVTTTHTFHRWVSWYEALVDLIPSLEPSKLTSVQLLNIAPYGWQVQLVERVGGYDNRKKVRLSHQPAWTIKAGLGTDGKGCDRTSFIDAVLSQADVRRLNTKGLGRVLKLGKMVENTKN